MYRTGCAFPSVSPLSTLTLSQCECLNFPTPAMGKGEDRRRAAPHEMAAVLPVLCRARSHAPVRTG